MKKTKNRVLVVEDDPILTKNLCEELRDNDCEVFFADTAKKGIEIALKEKPDIITLDIMLPDGDGISFLKVLRADIWGKDVEVVLLTNVGALNKVSEALTFGVSRYFVKADNSLEQIVEQVLS